MIAVGVDTHKHEHLAVAVDALGQLLAEMTITATLAGYRELLAWITGLEGEVRVGIEGAGSYGVGLCEYLQDNAITVFEVERPKRRERRIGKSDQLDALLTAKKVLPNDGLSTPRGHGKRVALQMLLVAYHSVVSERSRLYNQLQALHVTAPATLREGVGTARNGTKLAQRLTGMRTRPNASLQENTTLQVLRDIANRTRALDQQAQEYNRQIDTLARARSRADGRTRRRTDLRRQAHRVQPHTLQERGSVRTRQRHRPTTSVIRENRPSPPQPRRRPPDQHSDLHYRALTLRPPRPQPRLHPTPNQRRQDQARSHEIPQAIPLPRPLQQTLQHALDNIEASMCSPSADALPFRRGGYLFSSGTLGWCRWRGRITRARTRN